MTRPRIPLRRAKPSDSDNDEDDYGENTLRNATSRSAAHSSSRVRSGSNKRPRLSTEMETSSVENDDGSEKEDEDEDKEEDQDQEEESEPQDAEGERVAETNVERQEEPDADGEEEQSEDEELLNATRAEILAPENYDDDSEDDNEGMEDSLHVPKDLAEISHQPGAIVRVRLVNFVTYTDVTFEPGPSLNMVIGPNGTGKSTLVCAICLGLGYPPVHLGRAKDLCEFVKNGCSEGTIEIELQGRKQDETNPIIKRKLKSDNSSDYWINGKKSNGSKVKSLVQELAIQIDNLCQFLPQDKVCEFAALTPIDLLKETQRAACPPVVLQQHQKLIQLRAEHRKEESIQKTDQDSLTQMENRQMLLERDVTRLKQRASIQKTIDLLEKCIPFQQYREAKAARDVAKKAFKKSKDALIDLEKQEQPALEAKAKAQKEFEDVKAWAGQRRARFEAGEKNITNAKKQKIDTLYEKESEARRATEKLRKRELERRKELETARAAVQKFARQMQGEKPQEVNVEEYNGRIGDFSSKMARVKHDAGVKNIELENLTREARDITNDMNKTQQKIVNLDNISNQKAQMLKEMSKDTFKVYEWLQTHPNEFQSKVFGPPAVECSLKDSQYIDEVEALFNRTDKFAFTCTNREDYQKFVRIVYGDRNTGDRGLEVSEVTIKLATQKLEEQQPPCSHEEMRNLGFDGWALDFLNGPAPVLSMLCNEIHLHKAPITRHTLTNEQHAALQRSRINRWVENRNISNVNRRAEYGAAAVVVNSRTIRPGTIFKARQVNPEQRQNLRDTLGSLTEARAEKKATIDALQLEVDDMVKEFDHLRQQRKEISDEKTAKQKLLNDYNNLEIKLESKQKDVERLEEQGRNFKPEMVRLEKDLLVKIKDRLEGAMKYAEYVDQYAIYHNDVVQAELRLLESHSNLQNIIARNRDIETRLNEKKRELEELRAQESELRQTAKEVMDRCRVIIETTSEEDRDLLKEWKERSVADLNAQIQAEQSSLDAIHEGNPNAIKVYEAREADINNLRDKMERQRRQIDRITNAIKRLQAVWEPQINELMENISAAFSKSFEYIGCAGQVQVHKEGIDFEKWAVQIMVKFRETESLQVLTAQRQSGGERAVSTVFYLMALQALARAPFRVVDEINQGMDPRNERLVHKRMVKIACKKHTSQYFLITPKLLVDLDYHERMKVLCINSGELVGEGQVMDYERYLTVGRSIMASA